MNDYKTLTDTIKQTFKHPVATGLAYVTLAFSPLLYQGCGFEIPEHEKEKEETRMYSLREIPSLPKGSTVSGYAHDEFVRNNFSLEQLSDLLRDLNENNTSIRHETGAAPLYAGNRFVGADFNGDGKILGEKSEEVGKIYLTVQGNNVEDWSIDYR